MILELRNIFKTYLQGKLEVPVLKNVSLFVEKGEYVAIMGPSGSGKTTLMNLIGCLDSPTSGEYLLEGEDLSRQSDKKLSEVRLHSIGFVFQSFYLLPRQSALENVALPLLYAGVKKKERLAVAKQALERVGLGDRTNFKPTQLSGGQCQRVAIARAIVNNPKVLLADEPTGALDTQSGGQIMDIFHKLNEDGVTIVMITHEQSIADHARRIIHILDGRLVDEDGNFLASEEAAAQMEPDSGVLANTEADENAGTAADKKPLSDDLITARELLAGPLHARRDTGTEPLGTDIMADLEAAAQWEEALSEETAPEEFDLETATEADMPKPQSSGAPSLVARPTGENAPEQLSFDIWASPAGLSGSEEPTLPHEPEKAAADALSPLDGQIDWEEELSDPAPLEELAPQGGFEAPLKLDVDLSELLRRKDESLEPEGGFGKPIKTELDSLGLDSGEPSAHEEGDV